MACHEPGLAMVGELLKLGPPLEAPDRDFGSTPLGWAIHGSESSWERGKGDYVAVVEALLAAGAARPASTNGSASVRRLLAERGGAI